MATESGPQIWRFCLVLASATSEPDIELNLAKRSATQRRHSLSLACTLGYALTDCSRLLADLRRCRSLHQENDRVRSQPRNVSWCWPSDIARFSQRHLVRPAATLVNRCRTTDRSAAPNLPLRNQPPKLRRKTRKIGYSNDVLYHIDWLILDQPGTCGRTETSASR